MAENERDAGAPPAKRARAAAGYERRDGLRCVAPYAHVFRVHTKQRWEGRSVLSVFEDEFGYPRSFYAQQMAVGNLRVNGRPAALDATLRGGECVTHMLHRHEPPVSAAPVRVLAETAELLVVDKPSSIAVHPCGAFNRNCLTAILEAELGYTGLCGVHRLDRMTSGVLLLGKDSASAKKYTKMIEHGLTQKTYLARVLGNFPDGERVVDAPIECLQENHGRGFRNRVGPAGKPSTTVVRKLRYDPASDTSVLACRPLTGRTHQIRIHLAHLGHPIANDPLYNDELYLAREPWTSDTPLAGQPIFADFHPDVAKLPKNLGPKLDENYPFDAQSCPWCAHTWKDPQPKDLVMWLHALSYEGPEFKYVSNIPDWALDVTLDEIVFDHGKKDEAKEEPKADDEAVKKE